jgi:hypothetical protein
MNANKRPGGTEVNIYLCAFLYKKLQNHNNVEN